MAADRHTHNFPKCSHASVGLAQARPNDEAKDTFPQAEWHEYRHHSLPIAARPMSNTGIFF